MIDKIIELLNYSFIIDCIVIKNFTVFNENMDIEINIVSKEYGNKKLIFEDVKRLDVKSENYGCSPSSNILIEDITELGWEGLFYNIKLSDDAMVFYCKTIKMN